MPPRLTRLAFDDTLMAGHSPWHNIKHKKALIDNKRGKVWSKLCKAIMVAAKSGADPCANLRLRYAIDAAKAVSVPKENIERAVKKGSGELESESYVETMYEGYAPHGVAILLQILTDNRNRTAGEIRKLFDLAGGKMAAAGSVTYLFERKGVAIVAANRIDEDKLLEIALEAGADDIRRAGDKFEVVCDPSAFQSVQEAIRKVNVPLESADISYLPTNTVNLDANAARELIALMEKLDDHDDVQAVSANFNLTEAALAELEQI